MDLDFASKDICNIFIYLVHVYYSNLYLHYITFRCPISVLFAHISGFRSADCDFTFFLSFRYRLIISVSFALLIITISIVYILVHTNMKKEREQSKANSVLQVVCTKKLRVSRSYDDRFYTQASFNTNKEEQTVQMLQHGKLVASSVLVFATYLVCWSPRVAWLMLSCVDGCPFPLFGQTVLTRSMIGLVTENLIIIKSIVDPMIIIWRN